ncbi:MULTISPECIES: hypothetical protein [Mycobacteroides]|uniref:hypothetical protein n=1 Tax=Mycobacteroides TaxID=670516 RepID=UPI00092CCA03|nr:MULTISPECIES: hypothetical protein [Mycobacteroides]MBE5465145.1 hypothetical protein [Mycobacteroides abscessus]MDM2387024.1 hypothetical protein [Mycobacteroides abscessus]MDM2392225.1 hypothetical protein [Mycobacteroides abscessus]SIF67694.1 DNA segregation ATPase FtsK/SpoIIIE and related proteins [Mycobacteroides abscessus subsp. abscessus]SIF94237.1 DNA segregation ATPase FtsK/SpoIIIE and related proteins [Mycobacteroides abscessus subsp. abscessus]
MASATNRTEMLAKALMRARPDFTLHNARVFSRAVIDAPEIVFGAKPLKYLPRDTDHDGPVRFPLDEFAQVGGPHGAIMGIPSYWKPRVTRFAEPRDHTPHARRDALAGTQRPSKAAAAWSQVALTDARPGDLILDPGGDVLGVVVANGQVSVGGSWKPLPEVIQAGGSVHRVDVRHLDPLAELKPGDARACMLAQLLPLFGWEPTSAEAIFLDKVLAEDFRKPRGIETLPELVRWLDTAGEPEARQLREVLRFWITDPSPSAPTKIDIREPNPPASTDTSKARSMIETLAGSHWDEPILKLWPPQSSKPQVQANDADPLNDYWPDESADVAAIVADAGGVMPLSALFDQLHTALSAASTIVLGALSRGDVSLNPDRTVTLPNRQLKSFETTTNNAQFIAAVQLAREMERLPAPSPHPLPTATPSAREHAAFPLGVGATGEPVTYSPAADGHLLVFGGAGRGKSMLVRGLVRDALATNWWGARHLNSRKDPDAVLDQIRGVHAEIEIRRANPKLHKPELLALDDALWAHFDAPQREELHTLVTELLSTGRELGLHLVLITLTLDNEERFPSRWLDLCSTVLLTSKPTHDDAVKLMGDDAAQLPPSGWDGSGKMLLVRRLTGVSRPLRAYTQADKYKGY